MHTPIRSRWCVVHVLAVLIAISLSASVVNAQHQLGFGFLDEVRADSLDRPTGLAFLPDGRILVTEQWSGQIRVVTAASTLVATPAYTFTDLTQNYERGLLSVAVDPQWPQRPFIYCHYTARDSIERLVRLTGISNLSDPTGTTLRFAQPLILLDSLADIHPWHNGGSCRFGADGMLYFSLGDDGSACMAQDSTTLHGAILRLNVNGLAIGRVTTPDRSELVPPDNPYSADPNVNARLTYAFGFRNPFRFHVDPATGLLYVADVGENTWEEIDEVRPRDNAGWPHREAFDLVDYPYCPEPGGLGANSYLAPIWTYKHPVGVTIISAGIIRHASTPTFWPSAWEGNVLFADFMMGWMQMIHPNGDGSWSAVGAGGLLGDYFATDLSYPTDFAWGPDGNLWWTSYGDDIPTLKSGAVHRIFYDTSPAAVERRMPSSITLRVWPNPTRGPISISCGLPRRLDVRLSVFDLAGRRIATLSEGPHPEGPLFASWDGHDEQGRRAPSGVYLLRLVAGEQVRTVRVLRLE